jgi:hypothetical protein
MERPDAVRPAPALEVHTIAEQAQLAALLDGGFEYVARCRMLVVEAGEPSLAWTIIQP